LVRPDANSVVQAVLLAAGTRQTLPVGALRILSAVRNMGSTGTTPGRVITMGDRASQDAANPDWHSAPTGTAVREIFYDDKVAPLTFFVRPSIPASPAVYIELALSKAPTDVTDANTGDITVSDVYSPPLQAWMLYRAFMLQTQATNVMQRGAGHFQSFFNLLGVKLRADMFASPNRGGALIPSPTNLGVGLGNS
jgi:hypothetical protein